MKKFWTFSLLCLLGLSASTITSKAASSEAGKLSLRRVVDTLFAVRDFSEVSISPDGRRVAWVESLTKANGMPSSNTAIYVQDLEGASPRRRLTAGNGVNNYSEQGLAWSPDSSRLAFLSDAGEVGQSDLYVTQITQGSPRRLTRLTGSVSNPQWSPDGKTLAFLYIKNAPRAPGPLEPMTPPSGVIEQRIYEQRLSIVDVTSGTVRQITPPDLYVYEYAWSPNSQHLVATAAAGVAPTAPAGLLTAK